MRSQFKLVFFAQRTNFSPGEEREGREEIEVEIQGCSFQAVNPTIKGTTGRIFDYTVQFEWPIQKYVRTDVFLPKD